MFRLRDYGAPFLPGMDREFPCPICTAADVNGHAFPAVEILDPPQLDAVRELHYPVEIEPSDTICGECSYQLPNGRYFGEVVEYPCPTICALGGA